MSLSTLISLSKVLNTSIDYLLLGNSLYNLEDPIVDFFGVFQKHLAGVDTESRCQPAAALSFAMYSRR